MTSSTICSHHRIRTVLLMCVVLLSASLHAQAQKQGNTYKPEYP